MRIGPLWRSAVLASLALLASGQLCMLTTCVPRLTPHHAPVHACCHALPSQQSPAPAPASSAGMPCSLAMHSAAAPTLESPPASIVPAALLEASASLLAPPVRGSAPRAPLDTGPAPDRYRSAPADLRAPPQA